MSSTEPRIIEALDPTVVPPPPAQRLTTLPNGLEIACQTAKEVEHIYDDVFAHRVYLSHGVTLWDGATVFDVGGNIGLFTVFVHQSYRNVSTYTFEPAPPLFQIVRPFREQTPIIPVHLHRRHAFTRRKFVMDYGCLRIRIRNFSHTFAHFRNTH